MKLACIVHRYGPQATGGSEAHCRAIATRLAERHDVTVLTSCATDYITWRNELPPGESRDGAVRVLRFPVTHPRHLNRFRAIGETVFNGGASEADQERWFMENGPLMPSLLDHLSTHGTRYDAALFWSFRYYPAFFGLPLVADRAILVPTAEDDEIIRTAPILRRYFARPRGYLFLTPEERTLVASHCDGPLPPSAVIGAGLDAAAPLATDDAIRTLREAGVSGGDGLRIARAASEGDVRGGEDNTSHDARDSHGDAPRDADTGRRGTDSPRAAESLAPFAVYVGRVERNKGCERLLDDYRAYLDASLATGTPPLPLLLAGPIRMPIPAIPSLRALGFVSNAVRDALLAQARVFVMPSPFESLNIALLEAWNHGTPALINGRCAPLKGQLHRANGGLFYDRTLDFVHTLHYFATHAAEAHQFGAQGRAYVEREYRWPVVMGKIEALLQRIAVPAR